MIIKVTKDKVSIEQNKLNHYGEYNVNECNFEFDEHFNSVLVKRAIFTSKNTNKTIEIDIINNKCVVPSDILLETYDQVTLGVYGYNIEGEELLVRYSPEPTYFTVQEGSYKEGAEQPEIITPTQYDMYSKALQEGLAEVDERLDDVEKQGDYASEQGDYAKEQGDYAKSEGDNAKSVAEETEKKAQEGAFDGKSLEFVWEGTKLGVRLEGQEEYHFVDLQGVQGEIGATGEPFKIKKTYGSVSEMNADFANMEFGDYVMIASSVNEEDNAKLYTKGESAWIFISDFSGAMGIRGETGLTPNIQIGEVKTLEPGSQVKVTRSGSNEEPVLNFEIPKGDKGEPGADGEDYVLTEADKEEIADNINEENNTRITENEKDIADLEATIDILTNTDTKKGELVHITDALPLPTFETTTDGNVEQETTQGYNLINIQTDNYLIMNTANTDKRKNYGNGIILDYADYNSKDYRIIYVNYPFKADKYYCLNALYTKLGTLDATIRLYLPKTEQYLQNGKPFKPNTDTEWLGFYVQDTEFVEGVKYAITDAILQEVDSLTATPKPYEPFTNGASPNPEYPQEIEVLEGYNLLKLTTFSNNSKEQTKNGVTATINDNGTITCKGTATDTTYFYFTKINLDFTLGDGYFACNSPSTNQRIEFVCNVDGVDRYLNSYGKGMFIKATTSFEFKHITMYFTKGEKVDTTFTPMFAKGRYNKPFVPYGCICIRNSKNQLLDFSGTESYSGINKTFENDVLTVSGDGSTAYHSWSKNINHICFANPGKTLYFDYEDIKSASPCNGSVVQLNVRYNDGTQPLYLGMVLRNFTKKDVWTIPNDTSNIEEVSIGVYTSNASPAISNTITITKPRLSFYENSEYEPYQEQIVYLDLKGNFVGKIKDSEIEDELYTDKKNIWLDKNVNKRIFTGEEDWVENTSVGTIELLINDKYARYGFDGLMCSHFHIRTGTDTSNYVGIDNNHTNIRIWGTNMTRDEFKAFAKEEYNKGTPITLVYQTKKTETKHLGELPEPIKTFEGANNIQLLANLDTEIEVTYALDVKKYFENKLASIQEQIL